MWRYEKRLQYPVKITQSNPKLAQYIMSQYGGPDGVIHLNMIIDKKSILTAVKNDYLNK